MSYSSHNDNAKFGLALSALAFAGYGLYHGALWVIHWAQSLL